MKIIYTYTDEAPALATHSFLPIIEAFAGAAGVEVELRDISLAARILAQFPDALSEDQRVPDALAELGELAKTPEANIIKLPNISASIPQLKAAIKELQDDGYAIPDYPENPQTDEDKRAREAYDRVKGSAVNPVLREGNSDRRAPASVKEYVRKHPHSMGDWSQGLQDPRRDDGRRRLPLDRAVGDGRGRRRAADRARRRGRHRHRAQGGRPCWRARSSTRAVMRRRALDAFLAEQIADAKAQGVLFSLHLKATMMKVSDPIIFGHAVRAFFADVFEEHGDALASVGATRTTAWPAS